MKIAAVMAALFSSVLASGCVIAAIPVATGGAKGLHAHFHNDDVDNGLRESRASTTTQVIIGAVVGLAIDAVLISVTAIAFRMKQLAERSSRPAMYLRTTQLTTSRDAPMPTVAIDKRDHGCV